MQNLKSVTTGTHLILAAIETIGLTPLTDYLSSFGGWPMTLSHWDESTFDWKKASASAFTTFNLPLLVDFSNDLDSNNTQSTAIYVDQESLSLPRSILVDLNDSPVIVTAYIELMIESAKTVRDWLGSDVSDVEIEAQSHEVLKFESQLAMVRKKKKKNLTEISIYLIVSQIIVNSIQITVQGENRRNSTRMYNPMSLAELQNWTDKVNTTSSQAKVSIKSRFHEIDIKLIFCFVLLFFVFVFKD